ncbi:MAG: HD domain-containing protein [Anaerolineales bacterium]|nr:HD domain-containing protein [Anaerolineales bacterium]
MDRKSQKVVIIQFDPVSLHELVRCFKERGDTVITAVTLEDANSVINRHRPDLVVLDVQLLGENWTDKISKLVQQLKSTKILLTANGSTSQDEDVADSYRKWGVLLPPFTTQKIEQRLASSPAPTEAARPKQSRLQALKVRFPIRAKITLPYVFLAVLLAVAGAYVVTQLVMDTIEERFTNQLIETGRLSSEWMVREEDQLLQTLRLISHARGMSHGVLAADAEGLRELVLPIAINEGVEAVEILDVNGESLISLHHEWGGRPEDYAVTRGDDVYMQWDFVAYVLNGRTDSLGDKYAGIARTVWGDMVYFSGPVHDQDGNVVGVVLVGESLRSIAQKIREATLAQVSIYGLTGQPLVTTHLETPAPLEAETASDILLLQNEETFTRDRDVADIRYREIMGPLELRGGNDVGLIGTSLPQAFLVRASQATWLRVFSFITIALALVIAVGIFVAGRLTNPLLQVVQASLQVTQGNLNVKVEPSGSDEVTTLAHTFNRMVDSLNTSKQRLQKAHEVTVEAYDKTIEGWSKALELRDQDTEGHTQRVTEMTMRLAKWIGVPEAKLTHIRRGALLHDIGKMGIPDAILNKDGLLTDEEWQIMRRHPTFAYEMLSPILYLRPALQIPLCHHEKWDGTGYPRGLEGEKIPLEARIFAVVDVWDALSSDRPYREAWSIERVVDLMISEKGAHFDPRVVNAFVEMLESEGLLNPAWEAEQEVRQQRISPFLT